MENASIFKLLDFLKMRHIFLCLALKLLTSWLFNENSTKKTNTFTLLLFAKVILFWQMVWHYLFALYTLFIFMVDQSAPYLVEKTFEAELLCTFFAEHSKIQYVCTTKTTAYWNKMACTKSPIKAVKMSNLALRKIRLGLEGKRKLESKTVNRLPIKA